MKLLILGGTGTISRSVTREAVQKGMEVTTLTRGIRAKMPGVSELVCDVLDTDAMRKALLGQHFDVVADFLTFLPEQAQHKLDLFEGKTDHYLFISSATVYQKPPQTLLMQEASVPLDNPFWSYAQHKIACENLFMAAHHARAFPVTVVRPSYTYDEKTLPFVFNSHKSRYAVIKRMKEGKPIVIPGDGNVFWTITHASDFARAFVGLMGNPRAVGEAFHITADERHTWDGFARIIADALKVDLTLIHIATDTLTRFFTEEVGPQYGDKGQTAVFDNSKIKAFVPGFECAVPFAQGIADTLTHFDTHPQTCLPDEEWDARVDSMIAKIQSIHP